MKDNFVLALKSVGADEKKTLTLSTIHPMEKGESGYIMADAVWERWDEFRSDELRLDELRVDEFRLDEFRLDEFRLD